MDSPFEIFFSYAHEDEDLMHDVRRQLVVYERNGRILKWYDRKIPPGAEWRQQIDTRLETAKIILLFMSPHFIESRYCYEVEGQTALRRHSAGQAAVVPVILRPCSWEETPFSKLQVLPRDAKPVSRWEDRDEACLAVARGVMTLVDELIANQSLRADEGQLPSSNSQSHSAMFDQRNTISFRSPREPMILSDGESVAELSSFPCTSPACRSQDVALADGVEISEMKAEADVWHVHGIVQMEYSIHGECRTCGRLFQVVKRQIPVQFPELACNECERRTFLEYRIQELKRVAGGFEFAVEIRCSGCRGRKRVTKLLKGLLHAIGLNVGLKEIKIQKSAEGRGLAQRST